ncbi:MAG TPA: hypothetical protein DCY25_07720 [Bacteroidales bacterium]|nr:hypothetical protein [Bacteroidales bacterium]
MKKRLSVLALLFAASIMISFTQIRVITGKVTDSSGSPMPGVSIIVKGTTRGTVTDTFGNYRIELKQGDDILQYSMIGYMKVNERIRDRTRIDVVMHEEKLALDEVVVTGYGSQKRKALESQSVYAPAMAGYAGDGFMRYNRNFNTEGYAATTENGFRSVRSNPLSTFSIDVDNASYSNMRRFLNNGTLPPPEAVRVEEMINFFRYDYPEPDGIHPFSVSSELSVCPWNRNHQLLMVGLKGKSIDKSVLPQSNLVFLIDVSGSMNSPDKLPLLQSALGLLVNELRPQDRVAIVVYAGAAGLVLESTPGNRKDEIMNAIAILEAGGSTAGGAGLRLAYATASENFIKGGNNRIILATDGDFNVGESSNGGMERLVEDNRDRGIFMTVLGFGTGNIKDDKMEIIADKGNGNYSYIDNLQEARRVLVKEFGGTLLTIARDVKFQIEFNPARVQSYRLIGYENRLLNEEDFNDDRKDAGEMGSGHNVTALYELVPAGTEDETPAVDPLKYQDDPVIKSGKIPSDEFLIIKIRYKKPEGSSSVLLEKAVRDYVQNINEASDNLQFAAAVAEFGMILRYSEFKGSSSVDEAVRLARSSRGSDREGYRSEFIRLMELARDLGVMAER